MQIKLNGRNFYTTEVIEAESQATLNTTFIMEEELGKVHMHVND
jgi:hypothetical protein